MSFMWKINFMILSKSSIHLAATWNVFSDEQINNTEISIINDCWMGLAQTSSASYSFLYKALIILKKPQDVNDKCVINLIGMKLVAT